VISMKEKFIVIITIFDIYQRQTYVAKIIESYIIFKLFLEFSSSLADFSKKRE
jgi:hypothetical protein